MKIIIIKTETTNFVILYNKAMIIHLISFSLQGKTLSTYLNPPQKVQKKVKRELNHTLEKEDTSLNNKSQGFKSCPKFHNEPQTPPRTPFQVFALKFKESAEGEFASVKEHNKARTEKWKKLSDLERAPFITSCRLLQDNYRLEILKYVSSMDKTMRSIYLKFNHSKHCHYFKEDIYKDAFPNEKYPVNVMEPSSQHSNSVLLSEAGEESNHSVCDQLDSDEDSDDVKIVPKNLNIRRKTSKLHRKTNKNIPHTAKTERKPKLLTSTLIQHDQPEKKIAYAPWRSDINERPKRMSAGREESGSSDECNGALTTHSGTRGVQYHSESSTESEDQDDTWKGSSIASLWKTAGQVSFLSALQQVSDGLV